MNIHTKNDYSYMFLLKIAYVDLLNVDVNLVDPNNEKVDNSYMESFLLNFRKDNETQSKLDNLINTFLEGYDFDVSQDLKVVSGLDKDFDSMVTFLQPYITKNKSHSFISKTKGYEYDPMRYAYVINILSYYRITIKMSKKEVHRMKLKNSDRYEILTNNLNERNLLKYIING